MLNNANPIATLENMENIPTDSAALVAYNAIK